MITTIGEKRILRSALEPPNTNWLWLKTVDGFPALYEYLSGKWVPFSSVASEYADIDLSDYYTKVQVDHNIGNAISGLSFDINKKLPFFVPVTSDGNNISSQIDFGAIHNAIFEDKREVVVIINNSSFFTLMYASVDEVVFSNVSAQDGVQTLLSVTEGNEWSAEDVLLSSGGGSVEQVQADWNQTTTTAPDYIKNKPTIPAAQIQSDWNQTNTSAKDFIKNKPTIPDTSNLATKTELNNKQDTISDLAAIRSGAAAGATAAQPSDLPTKVSDLTNDSGFTSNSPATAAPLMDDTANVGSSAKYAREDHVHPHDTSKLSKSDVSVETQGDGTVNINVKDDTYTINLNHTHEGMVKLEKVTEATLPQTMADDTIYVQVDNATTPTEIEALHIFGLEFVGGGAAPGTPAITSPSGTTLNLGINEGAGVEMDVVVKGRHLTGNLTMSVANNSGLSLSYGQSTGQSSVTIDKAVAETAVGATVKVVYSGTGALELDDAVTISGGGAETKYLKAVVVDRYAGFVFDKALTQNGLTDVQGKCVTPEFDLESGGHFLTINFGYNTGTYGACGYTSEDAFVDTWTASKVIRSVKLGDTVTKIKVTLDSSNLANCFIYDETDDVMLFKGANVTFDDPYPGVLFGKKITNGSGSGGQTGDNSSWCVSPMLDLPAAGHTVSINFGFTSGVPSNASGMAGYTESGVFVELFSTSASQRTINLSSYPTIRKLMLPVYLSGLEGGYVHDDTTNEYLWKGLNVQ